MPRTAQKWQFAFHYSCIFIPAYSIIFLWTELTWSNVTVLVFIQVHSDNDKGKQSADVTELQFSGVLALIDERVAGQI